MANDFKVIDIGYIGSFIEERADNDGDNLRKDVSLDVPDNNVYIINPITGLLEKKIKDADTDNPTFVQFNSEKPVNPTTNLIIKNIGRTIKVVNVKQTELCVNTLNTSSNFTYGQPFPSGSEHCEKAIYFTSNEHIMWPMQTQTQAVLDDLSKKIPYDIGFSKKYYDIDILPQKHLQDIETETKISSNFLNKFKNLFLFDTEYSDNIEFSNIKISKEWDGYSVDKNNSNNLVYSDFFKLTSASFTPFTFLASEKMLTDISDYFYQLSVTSSNVTIFNPNEWITEKYKIKPVYGRTEYFNTIISSSLTQLDKTEEILNTIVKKELYKMDPTVTDLGLVEDVISTEIFLEIVNNNNGLFTINDGLQIQEEEYTDYMETKLSNIMQLMEKHNINNIDTDKRINKNVYGLIQKYIRFQIEKGFPSIDNVIFNTSTFNNLIDADAFLISTIDIPEKTYRLFVNNETGENIIIEQTEASVNNILQEDTNNITSLASIPNITYNENTFAYKRFDRETDYTLSDRYFITKPLFSKESDRHSNFYTSSAIKNHEKYYIPVYNYSLDNPLTSHIFDISYAHIDGSGSSYIQNGTELYPAKTMYKKYMADCFAKQEIMKFKNGKESSYFYILQFDRNAFKDRLDSSNLQITLCPLSSSSNQLVNTGSNFEVNQSSSQIFTLIDDSRTIKVYSSSAYEVEEFYNLVEGTIQDGLKYDENANAWGMVFPNKGLIILDGEVLDQSCSFNTVTASIDGDNIRKMFLSLSGSCSPNQSRNNHGYWYMRSADLYADENYFCRIGRNEFNYTNNYTYISGSSRKFFTDRVNNTSKTYISTIGLYNESRELLAVGKLRKPLLKDSGLEYIFNMKIKVS